MNIIIIIMFIYMYKAPGQKFIGIYLRSQVSVYRTIGPLVYDSEKIGPQGFICPHPGAIYMYITMIFKHLRNCLANESQILYEAFIGRGNQCVHENPGHMTKMATMPIYGKNSSYFSFVQLLYLLTHR